MKLKNCNIYILNIVKRTEDTFLDNWMVKLLLLVTILTLLSTLSSCRKYTEVPPPRSRVTTSEVFSTDAQATSAMAGVYYMMINNNTPNLLTGGITIYAGLSSDELMLYDLNNSAAYQFNRNALISTNPILYSQLWSSAFSNLYQTNAVIEGLANSTTLSDSVKRELLSEAKFVSAFINFNLINLFGAIPYVTVTDWRRNNLLERSSPSQVYQNIISNLKDAQAALPNNYSVGGGQRIIPNKWAATALLARVYLYSNNFPEAEAQATQVIASGLFSLSTLLNDVFKPNSSEAIWQLQQDNKAFTFNATTEGASIIPLNSPIINFPPLVYIGDSLFNSFEINDNRKSSWLKSKSIAGKNYYYPYKYKVGRSDAYANGAYAEYYMILRLAEQYLIRAEARLKQNNLTGAISDLNAIRLRAGLPELSNTLSEEKILDAIIHERRIELFAEWGHRWLDLKRLEIGTHVLALNKGITINNDLLLYPIPASDILVNPNLTQNNGY